MAHLKGWMASSDEFTRRVRDCADRLAACGVDALGALFDLTSNRLVRYAVTLTRHQHDAEDAVQTALVRVAREPGLLGEVAAPWPYLLRMVRNEALVIARRQHRLAAAGDLSDLVRLCRVDELEQEETHRAVWSALRGLPPEQAEVVVLKIWEAMTFSEIGRVLGASPNTVASRYQYAMAKLTQRLAKQRQEAPRG
jgi:RNA polymerase sigma-70 factor, ECF subfamily